MIIKDGIVGMHDSMPQVGQNLLYEGGKECWDWGGEVRDRKSRIRPVNHIRTKKKAEQVGIPNVHVGNNKVYVLGDVAK